MEKKYIKAWPRPDNAEPIITQEKGGGATMKAKAFLFQIRKLDSMIQNKRDEREQWLAMAVSTTAGAAPDTGVRVQSSGSQQRMADAVDRSVDIEADIERMIRRLYEARKQIIGVIEQLREDEYSLLHDMYVGKVEVDPATGRKKARYLTLGEAAYEAGKSYSWARGVNGRAIKHVQRIIDTEHPEPVEAQIRRWNSENCAKV